MDCVKNSNPKNIGIVTTWFERGAAYVSKAYSDLLDQEHAIFIYARGGEEYAKGESGWDEPNVTFAPKLENYFVRGDKSMSRIHFANWIRSNKISLVIFNEQRDVSLVKMLSKHGFITGAYVDYYKKDTVREFDVYDFLLCNTQRHYSVFRHHRNPIFFQWGTNVTLFKPKAERIGTNKDLTFFHSAGFGGANGRKGTDLLVKAFQLVKGRTKLIIHSQVTMETFGEETAKIIVADTRIDFIKRTVGAPGLYHLGQVYVYPSKLEGIGLSVPEALSCGLPVITTNCPPMSEFVVDGENGFLVQVNHMSRRTDDYYWPESVVDIKDLAVNMQKYIDDRNLLSIHAKNARQSALLRFNWKENGEILLAKLADYGKQSNPVVPWSCYFSFFIADTFRLCTLGVNKLASYTKKLLLSIKHSWP